MFLQIKELAIMLTRIENAEVYYRFMIAYRKHNAECPVYTTFRTCKTTGRVTEFTRQRGVIAESVKTTFYVILQEYIESYNQVTAHVLYSNDNPPPLYTNSVFLANRADCSDRTVRNHLRLLRNLGVIQTKFRGRKHDYELWISKDFLYGSEGDTVFKKREIDPKTAFPDLNMKKFPANNTHREVFEKEKGKADMFINHGESNDRERGRTEVEPLGSNEAVNRTEVGQTGGAAAQLSRDEMIAQSEEKRRLSAEKALEGRLLKGPRGLETKYLNLLLDFWFYAWKVLYPAKEFTKDQQEKALIAICAGVYGNFQDERTDKEWIDFQVFQLGKLDKAGKYYDHHPEQYAPDPYAFAIPGKGYFDAENLKGFAVIDAWIKKEMIQKTINKADRAERNLQKQAKCAELLRKARIDMEMENAGKKLRKETRGKTRIGIYQYYHNILRAMGNKYADQLDKQYIDQQARGFAPPKYDQAKRVRRAVYKLSADPTPATVVYTDDWIESDQHEGFYLSEI